MLGIKQETSPIDVLAEIRQNWRIKQETEETTSACKRTRDDDNVSEDEIEAIISRRVKRQRSPPRQASQILRESRTNSVVSTQVSLGQSERSSAASSPITAHTKSNGLSQRPKIRLTENGATLFLCQHEGCEKPCRTLKLLQQHVEIAHALTIRNTDVPPGPGNEDVPTVNTTQKDSPSDVTYDSSALIAIDELKPEDQLQKSVNEEDTTSRAKPQPGRWRQRQNHPLFTSPDSANTSVRPPVLRVSENLSAGDGSSGAAIASQVIALPEIRNEIQPAPAKAVGLHKDELAHLDQSSAKPSTPLECPVSVCSKTFKFKRDIQYHWTNDHKGQRLVSSGNGSFHLLDPETNQPSSDPEVNSFVCEDCGSRFKGVHGLDFYKSRSPKCSTPSRIHPELLMYTASLKTADQPQGDTDHAPPPAGGVAPERTAITAPALDKDQIKVERHSDNTNRGKPAKLTIDTQNVLPANPVAEDTKSERLVGSSIRQLGLSSDSSDEEQTTLDQRASMKYPKRRVGQRLPPDPDSWAEAMDADRRLVIQGQRDVKWRVIQEAWTKSTGLRTSIPTLQYRQARLVSIIGNEAMQHSQAYIDNGEESAGFAQNPELKQSNVRAVRKQLGFPLSWDQASKADKKLVSMKEKGHKWSTIVEEFQMSIHRHMRPQTCKSRYHRLVELRDKALPSPPASAVTPNAVHTKGKTEQRSPTHSKDNKNNNKAGELSDGVSVYSISDDSSEDEGPLSMLRFRRQRQTSRGPMNADQLKSHARSQSVSQDFGIPGIDRATDPDKMLAAMQEGKERWPKVREAWENATNRKTPINYVTKQDLGLLNDDDINLLLAAEAVVEARFARAKYATVADVMRANGVEEHKANFVNKHLGSLCKSSNLPKESCSTLQEVSTPDPANTEQKSDEFQKKLLESCAQQISIIAEANRLEMEKKFEALRQQARKSESEVTNTVDKAAVQADNGDCRDEKGPNNPNVQASSGQTSNSDHAQHQVRGDAFACRRCPARFVTIKKLFEHLKSQNHWGQKVFNSDSPNVQTRAWNGPQDRAAQRDDIESYTCKLCSASFPTNWKLHEHLHASGHKYQKKPSHLSASR